ncbi:MAG: EMC3/TMCO1 family protein [Aigarchaeota archaeon]|nr:EMC3/TMCO1 family protein [Aigarchaeota archaeon]
MSNPLLAQTLSDLTIDRAPLSTLVIFGVAVGVALFSAVATRLTQGKDSMRKRTEVTMWKRKLYEAKKSGDKKAVAKLERKKDYYTKLEASLSMKTMKTYFVTIIPIFAVFYLLSFAFPPVQLQIPGQPTDKTIQVGVPVARLPQLPIPFISDAGVAYYNLDGHEGGIQYLIDTASGPVMGYYWWYFLVYLMVSSLVGRALKTSPTVWEEELRAEEGSKNKEQKKG